MAGEGVGITNRVAKVTLPYWAKRAQSEALRRYVLLKILQRKGKIVGGKHGGQLRWPFKKGLRALVPYVDLQATEFARSDLLEDAVLRWASVQMKDMVSELEELQNAGKEAIVAYVVGIQEDMQEDAIEEFGKKPYADGDSATNEFFGLESFMAGIGAQTAADDFATSITDSYAGHSCAYGTFGGTSDDDAAYKVWSPVIVNTNQNPGGGAVAWSVGALEYLRKGIIEASYGNSEKKNLSMIVLRKNSFRDLENILDDKERVNLVAASEFKAKYGFSPVSMIHVDGCPVTWEVGVPSVDANADVVHGYGLNCDQMELCLLGKQPKKRGGMPRLFHGKSAYDPFSDATLLRLKLHGQWKFKSPRYFVKWADIS